MKLLTALGLSAALLLSAQPAAAVNAPTLRSQAVCLKVLKKANAARKPAQLKKCDFLYADLSGANLRNAILWGSDLRNANFTGADLRGAQMRSVYPPPQATNANFTGANLTGASLWNLDLTNANFTNANLTYADFSTTKDAGFGLTIWTNVNFTGANLTLADLKGADLTNVVRQAPHTTPRRLHLGRVLVRRIAADGEHLDRLVVDPRRVHRLAHRSSRRRVVEAYATATGGERVARVLTVIARQRCADHHTPCPYVTSRLRRTRACRVVFAPRWQQRPALLAQW